MTQQTAERTPHRHSPPGTAIGVGTYHLTSDRGVPHEEAVAIVRSALDLGVDVFDVAPMYGLGEAEQILGEALDRAGRRDVRVVGKVGRFEKSILMRLGDAAYLDRRAIRAQFDHSMRLLRLDRLPLLLIHETDWDHWWPSPGVVDGPVLEVVDELRQEGLVGQVGLSVRDAAKATRLCRTGLFDSMLFVHYYNMVWQEAGGTAIAAAAAQGMEILVGAVFRQGLLTGTDPETPARLRAERGGATPPGIVERIEAVQQLSRSSGLSMTELGVRWFAGDPRVGTVLTGPRSVLELHRNVEALARGALPADVRARIDRLREIPLGRWS